MTTETSGANSNAVALRPSGRLAITDDQDYWTTQQYAGLKALGITGATEGDLAVFFHQCRRTRLDPFSRQIYLIGRRTKERWQDERGVWQERWVNKQTIQVGIDGFRVMRDRVAERTRSLAEFEDTVWYDADGREHKVWLADEPPVACKVVLVKHDLATGRTLRFPAVLRTKSYMQVNAKGEPVSQWKTQAEHMIEKCCEAFSTRRAYPNDFSGIYLEEEMQGRSPDADTPPPARMIKAGDIIVSRSGAEEIANRMGPAPEGPTARTVTAQEVNDHFRRLGFTVKDKQHVLAAAGTLAGLGKAPAALADLTPGQLAAVAESLESCGERGDLVALLAEGIYPADDAAEAAAERAFKAGEADE